MSGWSKAKNEGKAAFDKGWALFEKLGVPANKLAHKIGSEAFWPQPLGPECDKCARILKSFCKDGFYKESSTAETTPGPKSKPHVLVKIPQKVIQNCVGLAIFTTMRTGLWVSGAGGSGVLIARKEDGSWSPPSGILIHTVGLGFMAGIDIYDCVVMINNREALAAFSKLRVSLGPELSVVAGPVGAGGSLESEVKVDHRPVLSYMKSRGFYGGLQMDGTVIIERNDANAQFYGEEVPVGEILKGHVTRIPPQTRMLMEVVKAADGRTDVDDHVLDAVSGPAPSDMVVEHTSEPTAEQQQQFAPPPGQYAPPPQGQFPPPPGQYPSSPGHYPPPPGQYPSPQGHFPPPPGNYPSPQGHFPPPPGQHPPSQAQYSPQGQYNPAQYSQQGQYPPPPHGQDPPSHEHQPQQQGQDDRPQDQYPPPPPGPYHPSEGQDHSGQGQ